MWVHKTPGEIARERRNLRTAFGEPVLFAILVSACFIIKRLSGIPEPGQVLRPLTVNQLLGRAATLALVLAVIAYLLQMILGRRVFEDILMGPRKVVICDKCYRMKNSDGQGSCDCGGTFEDFKLWKWVGEPPSQEGAGDNQRVTAAVLGHDAEPHPRGNELHRTDGIESRVTSWKGRTARLCAGNPRVRGIWNPAVLTRRGERALTLAATYDPPGTGTRALAATIIAVAVFAVVKGPSPFIGFILGSGVVVSYVAILLWRRRQITLTLENAGDVIVDQERSRAAFFLPFDHKPRWVVLELKEAFADASDAIRDVLGVKCRAGTIRGGNVLSVILLLVVGFVLAFSYCIVSAAW